MVTHKKAEVAAEPHYVVMAHMSEPDYEKERTFVQAELAFVERKLVEHSGWGWNWVSRPSLGLYSHQDWQAYGRELHHYAKELQKYAEEVDDGVLPLKFAVYNEADEADAAVQVKVHVKHGRLDERRKAPERPERLDGRGKGWTKLSLPNPLAFSRRGVKVTEHQVTAELSGLGAHDGAGLITQLVHVHTGPETEVTYDITSHNVAHETGEVELHEPEHTGQKPDSST